MKFLIKEISSTKTEIRVTLNSITHNGEAYYVFGETNGTFDEGSIGSEYIPMLLSNYYSEGPNPGIIRLIVAYLKDTIGTPLGFNNTVLVTKNNKPIPIVNIAVDDISLIDLSNDTIPSMVIKIAEELPGNVVELDEISVEKQIFNIQEQEVYYIPARLPDQELRGLDYDEGLKEEIGNSDIANLSYQNYNQLTSSFQLSDDTIISEVLSGSDSNLKVDYSKFSNHVFFGSAVTKLENFRKKIINIEKHLNIISQSLATASLNTVNHARKYSFAEITKEKESFTPYEKAIYYNGDKLGFHFNPNIGSNYAPNIPIKQAQSSIFLNDSGFHKIFKVSGSSADGTIPLFTGKYNVEDKPFYNSSGSFYLSFLMKGDESITDNIVWENNNQNYIPKLPYDTLYSSSILQPDVTASRWNRYIYHASMSYFTPHASNPIIGSAGGVTDFGQNSQEINVISNGPATGSYPIIAGGRYSNLGTTVTGSGAYFSGSIVPAGELFRIYINTNSSAITSSYITDVKVTKYNPVHFLPFAEVYSTTSTRFQNWYDDQYNSASLFDDNNHHSVMNNFPEFLRSDDQMDNKQFRNFSNMMGEHYDLIKCYVDNYSELFDKDYTEINSIPNNLIPALAKNYNWEFMLPFGKKEDGTLSSYLGSSVSNITNNNQIKNNIWRNILNNINYIYKTKGTQNSIRALLNSYGFPPDILKLREHGASLEQFDDSVLSDNVTNLNESLNNTTGNVSFTRKQGQMISYIIDNPSRVIKSKWDQDGIVSASAVEFLLKPSKGTNEQIILQASGGFADSTNKHAWDLILQPHDTLEVHSGSNADTVKSRLQFRLNKNNDGNGDITAVAQRVSMSTDYFDIKNQKLWNILLQKETRGSHNTTQTYKLYVAEQDGDKIKNIGTASMDVAGGDGDTERNTNQNWTTLHSSAPSNALVIGKTMTGSIAEFRVWQHALSMSAFKQHIYDNKSVVGNGATDSQTNLIYHYRLGENWPSGSTKTTKIKDANTSNSKDYSLIIPDEAFNNSSLYDVDVYDRIQFNIRTGGSQELSDNNIIIDADKRFVDNLNPTTPSFLSIFDPMINKRKASSTVEIVRSPQDVINDFILNQLGNFDFNDKFADPQDINKPNYSDLETFAKDFFDYYNISMDINVYIRAQANIFNKELIKSLKRLTPARAAFSKVGIEIKPTYLERPKLQNSKLEQEMIGVGPGEIKIHGKETNLTNWDEDVYVGVTISNLEPADPVTKTTNIPFTSHTGSVAYQFTSNEPLHKYHIIKFGLASNTGSVSQGVKSFTTYEPLYNIKTIKLNVASESGSQPQLTEEVLLTKNTDITAVTSVSEELDTYKAISFNVASSTGSSPVLSNHYETTNDVKFTMATATGSTPTFDYNMNNPYSTTIPISTATSSIANMDYEFLSWYDMKFNLASPSGSIPQLTEEISEPNNLHIPVSSATGSAIPLYSYEMDKEYQPHFKVSSASSSLANYDYELQNPYSTKIVVSTATSSKATTVYELDKIYSLYLNTTAGNKNLTGSMLFDMEKSDPYALNMDLTNPTGSLQLKKQVYQPRNICIPVATPSSSKPLIECILVEPKKGEFDFMGDTKFNDRLFNSYTNIAEKWGTGSNDTHFIHNNFGGKYSDFNTYHYDDRTIFYAIGDVETISGSVANPSSSFITDYTGTITNGIFTSSKDIYNKLSITTSPSLGSRPLGTTVEIRPSASISFKGGKFFDETLVYPANHIFIVGSSRDSINTLIFDGTQNIGGYQLDSEVFVDYSDDAIYEIWVTGVDGYYTQGNY